MHSRTTRTSRSHQIEIATVPVGDGAVGVTFCPGKNDPFAATGSWRRDIAADLDAIVAWGAAATVCLLERHELERLDVVALPKAVRDRNMRWLHLPIVDVSTPDAGFESAWVEAGAELGSLLAAGRRILVFCRGGLGRSGMIAARLLVERGMAPETAIADRDAGARTWPRSTGRP